MITILRKQLRGLLNKIKDFIIKRMISVYIDDNYIYIIYAEKTFFKLKLIDDFKIQISYKNYNEHNICNIIKEFIKTNKISPKVIRYVLKDTNLVLKYADIPSMSKKYIEKNIFWEMENELGEDFKNYNIYYKKVKSNLSKVFRIKVFAVPKDIIEFCISISKSLNLKIDVIEPLTESRERALKFLKSNKISFISPYYMLSVEKSCIDKDNFINNVGVFIRK
ncbi:MAG: hypothetical protein N2448_09225 [Caloramator sp.]|nr:hypothetical protein [Caloramator sp.]